MVPRIITGLAVFDISPTGLNLRRLAPEVALEEVRRKTAAAFAVGIETPPTPQEATP